MKWIKKGLIFTPPGKTDWIKSHAQCPTALVLEDRIRIYFSGRLADQQSLPAFIDVDPDDPSKITGVQKEPILLQGERGCFDEHGIIPSYVIRVGEKVHLYYAGWSRAAGVPYKNFTGLAISDDNGVTFKKFSDGPCFPMDMHNPLSATGPAIVNIDGLWHAIYSSGTKWHMIDGRPEHVYVLKRATSMDAVRWSFEPEPVIVPESAYHAYCKPAVLFMNNLWHMWYSVRGSHHFRDKGEDAYRLGHAVSIDFIAWENKPEDAGISVSGNGWDSEMICYPNIVTVKKRVFMFYNGNEFGKSGFGYAELE